MNDRKDPRPQPVEKNEAPDFLSDLRRVREKVGVTGLAALGFALVAIVAAILLTRVSG